MVKRKKSQKTRRKIKTPTEKTFIGIRRVMMKFKSKPQRGLTLGEIERARAAQHRRRLEYLKQVQKMRESRRRR